MFFFKCVKKVSNQDLINQITNEKYCNLYLTLIQRKN